ncbi:MAG: response regulator transcription factor [Bacillota bacterium]
MTIKVLIVDDHEVVRMGLVSFIQCHSDLQVIGEAENGEEAVVKALQLQPDVVIMDIRLGEGKNGIEACREIRAANPGIKVIMLTSFSDDETLVSSIKADAQGFVLKQTRGRELVNAIRTVGRGESLLDPLSTAKVLEFMKKTTEMNPGSKQVLSLQEKKILALIAEGKSNREIAKTLSLSEKTVKNYVSSIFHKLNFSNRAEAAAFAVRYNYKLM